MGEFNPPSQSRQISRLRPEGLSWSAILRVYPRSADVLAAEHLQTIEHYIQRRRHAVYNTIQGCDVLKECEGAEHLARAWPRKRGPLSQWSGRARQCRCRIQS